MIPYGLQRKMRQAPFETNRRLAVATGQARRPVTLERSPEDDGEVEATAR